MRMRQTGSWSGLVLRLVLPWLLAVVLLLLVHTASLGIHAHDHMGPGGSCAACALVNAAQELLKRLTAAGAAAAYLAACLFLAFAIGLLGRTGIQALRATQLKVRMNN